MRRRSGLAVAAVTATAFWSVLVAGAGAVTGPTQAAARLTRPGGIDAIAAVSCASPGTCSAAGDFTASSGHDEVFAITETRGKWGAGRGLPGSTALGLGRGENITSLSCGAPGNCTVFGTYLVQGRRSQALLDNERNGRWGKAREVPGIGALNTGGDAAVTSVACSSAGNCSAGGLYRDRADHQHPFVLSEIRGRWGTARRVPGIAALNTGGFADIASVSCGSAGNCSAGGSYAAGVNSRAFVVDELGGRWGTARRVPGSASLGINTQITAVSCASAGNCSAGGTADDGDVLRAFVVSEVHGRWHAALPVPGLAALNVGGDATLSSLSCGAPGNCSAGGSYASEPPPDEGPTPAQAYVVSERNGHWGKAILVPGSKTLNTASNASLTIVSCAGPGSCSATGTYQTSGSNAFVVSEVAGVWHRAQKIRGLAALHAQGNVELDPVSCAAPGNCVAGGDYGAQTSFRALIVSQKNGVWGKAMGIRGF